MKAIKRFFSSLKQYFFGEDGKADAYFKLIVGYIPEAMKLIEFVAILTPTMVDDAAILLVKSKFPKLFDETLTDDEKKLYLLATASELLKQKFPILSTTASRIAVQVAFGLKRVGEWIG